MIIPNIRSPFLIRRRRFHRSRPSERHGRRIYRIADLQTIIIGRSSPGSGVFENPRPQSSRAPANPRGRWPVRWSASPVLASSHHAGISVADDRGTMRLARNSLPESALRMPPRPILPYSSMAPGQVGTARRGPCLLLGPELNRSATDRTHRVWRGSPGGIPQLRRKALRPQSGSRCCGRGSGRWPAGA